MEQENDITDQSEDASLDKEWFEQIKPLMFESFEYLVPSKESMQDQKAEFLNGEIKTPKFEYPKLNADDLDEKEKALLALKKSIELSPDQRDKEIGEKDETEVAKQTYHWRINQMLAEIRMLRSSLNGDYKKFQKYSEFVYGKPDQQIFDYISNFTHEQIASVGEENELGKAAEDIQETFPETPSEITDPSSESFAKATDSVHEEILKLINIPEGELMGADQIAEGFERALKKLEADGWGVVVDRETGRSAISVSQANKIVNVPGSAKLSSNRFCELVAHEIGTHVARRIKGEKSKLMLLGLGLDRYDPGEEGVATMKEQVFSGSAEGYTKHGLYLGISLAYGLDGERRGFKEVYEILSKYNNFLNLQEGADPEKAKARADDVAWTQTVRIFRGTDGRAGICYTKDLAYLEGNIGVWDVIEKNSGELHRFSVGKYNPANSRHIAVMDRLGITDENLSEIAEG